MKLLRPLPLVPEEAGFGELLDWVAEARDYHHNRIEQDVPATASDYWLRDLFALLEEAIIQRGEDPHPNYTIALLNTWRGLVAIESLYMLVREELEGVVDESRSDTT
jgi:hypothetical protein